MPCRDYYDDHPQAYFGDQLANKDQEIKKLKNRISFAESALCGVLRAGEKNVGERIGNLIDLIDFEDAGIKQKELEKWFAEHKILDERIRKEAANKKTIALMKKTEADVKRRKKRQALAKLSEEERILLGVKL